jgi:DNA-binding HxlR family transcriptional regulator
VFFELNDEFGDIVKLIEKLGHLDKALSVVGKKYNLQIIDCINNNKNRAGFNLILKEVQSCNPRILSMRLKELEQNKLITKSIVLGTPVKTEYSLTGKAEDLMPIIDSLKKWAKN